MADDKAPPESGVRVKAATASFTVRVPLYAIEVECDGQRVRVEAPTLKEALALWEAREGG